VALGVHCLTRELPKGEVDLRSRRDPSRGVTPREEVPRTSSSSCCCSTSGRGIGSTARIVRGPSCVTTRALRSSASRRGRTAAGSASSRRRT